jgi:plasmid stability protein
VRVEDDLAEALKQRASRSGQSVNRYVNRLLRLAVSAGGPPSDRQLWKAAAIANHALVSRPAVRSDAPPAGSPPVSTPAGYAARLVSQERDDR